MRTQLDRLKPRRAVAMLVVLCCLWWSSIGSILHTDFVASRADTPQNALLARAGIPTGAWSVQSQTVSPPSDRCLACEWQANSVSAALPIQQVAPPCHTTYEAACSYLSHRSAFLARSSSRAPPAA